MSSPGGLLCSFRGTSDLFFWDWVKDDRSSVAVQGKLLTPMRNRIESV